MIKKNFNGFKISILIYCIVKMLSRFNFKWEAEPAAKETDETDSKSKEKPKKKKSRLEKALNEKLSELLQFLSMKLYFFLITISREAMQVCIHMYIVHTYYVLWTLVTINVFQGRFFDKVRKPTWVNRIYTTLIDMIYKLLPI